MGSNPILPPKREVEEWFISPGSGLGACRFESGLPDKSHTMKAGLDSAVEEDADGPEMEKDVKSSDAYDKHCTDVVRNENRYQSLWV